MFDKNLTESEREIKNSSEKKIQKLIPVACVAICISLTGGYIYYENQLNKMRENKPIENTYKEYKNSSEEDFKKFLENYTLSESEKAELENYMIKANKNVLEKAFEGTKQMFLDAKSSVNWFNDNMKAEIEQRKTENGKNINIENNTTNVKDPDKYDKMGHPYLKKGVDYKDPKNYTFENNGMGAPIEAPPKGKYIILTNPNTNIQWAYTSSNKWHISSQAEHDKLQAEINASQNRGMKNSEWSKEEIKQYVDGMVINMGSK